jgi:hypothetical protein
VCVTTVANGRKRSLPTLGQTGVMLCMYVYVCNKILFIVYLNSLCAFLKQIALINGPNIALAILKPT